MTDLTINMEVPCQKKASSMQVFELFMFDLYCNNIDAKAHAHMILRQQAFEQLMQKIQTVNLKKQLIVSMMEGYCGFTLYSNPYIVSFTKKMQITIIDMINKKLIDSKIFSVTVARFVGATVTIEFRYVTDIDNIMVCKPSQNN